MTDVRLHLRQGCPPHPRHGHRRRRRPVRSAPADTGDMRKTTIVTAAAAAVLLAGCGSEAGGGGGAARATASTTNSATSTSPSAASSASSAVDETGRDNCVRAGLAYAPILGGLSGSSDLEGALRYFTAPDIETATTDDGNAAQLAIAQLNHEMALANADVLTGSPLHHATLRAAYSAAEEACNVLGIDL